MSSDQETEERQSGRSRCSLRVRMRTEIIYWVWYRDDLRLWLEANYEPGGEALWVTGDTLLGDTGWAVAVIGDAPVEMGEDSGVDAAYQAVVRAGGVFGTVVCAAVGGESAEQFDVGFKGEERNVKGHARAEETAVDVVGEISAGIDGDRDGSCLEESIVEAKGSGGGPAFVCDLGLLAAHRSVDREFSLCVQVGGESSE